MMNQETANNLFYYDDGVLRWREAKGRALRDAPAGTNQKGYLITKINGVRYGNHRIIFLMKYGYLPLVVDHINGDTLDNRVENLREATSSQNMHNSKISRNNKSGIKGVFWNSAYKKWQGNVNSGGKQHFAGRFESIEDAQRAVINLRNKLHKEFVNHG